VPLLAPLGPGQDRDQELARELAALSSGDSAQRQAAERWLAAHLGPADGPLLAQSAAHGDLETRRRLARALGQADRDLCLASELLAQDDPALNEVGRRALELSVTAWSEAAWRRGIHGPSLGLHLKLLAADSWPQLLRLPILPSLGETCALLGRWDGLPIGLVVDPSVAARKPAEGFVEVRGSWEELVVQLGEIYRVSLDGHGFHPDPSEAVGPRFLRFCAPTRLAEPTSDVLIQWCALLAGEFSPKLRVAAARALADSGWDAALDWLSVRVEEEGDPAALEGLLSAAARGRVGAALGSPELLAGIRDTAQADLERGDPDGRAGRMLAAFRSLRDLGPGGLRRGEVLVEGWKAASPAGRWLRLAMLRRMRSPSAAPLAAEVLADAEASAVLKREALGAWMAATAGLASDFEPDLAAPERLFEGLVDLDEARGVASDLWAAHLSLPASWDDPARLPGGLDRLARAGVVAWLAMAGREEAVAAHWRASLGSNRLLWHAESEAFGELLLCIGESHGELLRAAWQLARGAGGGALKRLSIDRSAFLGGILPRPDQVRVWNELVATFERDGADLVAMAVISARGWDSSSGKKVRAQLMEALRQAFQDERPVARCQALLRALDRSVFEMRRIGWELSRVGLDMGRRSMAEQWSEQVRRLAERAQRSPLGAYLGLHWPPPLSSGVLDLARAERLPNGEF